ncbi:MAG: aspartate/glutamate racemase family protein [Prevotella sp.]|nr:aspartate/glutamate racemase family protein [Prevotella sp.]
MTPIGVFDSGYGGLTVLDSIRSRLPEYDYLYLGDNARAPYGGRSFEVVYQFTRQAVLKLFSMGCHLVILGCNTASAKALRTIQQHDLPLWNGSKMFSSPQLGGQRGASKRVLGIIRPTAELIGQKTKTRHVGLLATEGTVRSESYKLEIQKLFPDIHLTSVACPLWAPIVEAGEAASPGADYFVKKRIDQLLSADPKIDAVILGCTHYPLLLPKIKTYMPENIEVISQGIHVAESLENYLQRHPEIESQCSKNGQTRYFTTENPDKFQENAQIFLNEEIVAQHIDLQE